MKFVIHNIRLSFFFLLLGPGCFLNTHAEGIKQLKPDTTYYCDLYPGIAGGGYNCFATVYCGDDQKLYIRIGSSSEKVYLGFGSTSNSVTFRIKLSGVVVFGPVTITPSVPGFIMYYNQAIAGPNVIDPTGYNPLVFYPGSPGDYSIEFNQVRINKFDITVIDTAVLPLSPINGRLWSKDWRLDTQNIDLPEDAFLATQFIYSDDSIVTSVYYNQMRGHLFDVTSTSNGCLPSPAPWDSSCMSRPGDYHYAQYKIFINNPDSVQFPTGHLGLIDNSSINVTPQCNGSFVISFIANKPGKVNISIEVNPAPGHQPEDVSIIDTALIGLNTIIWNGHDGLGNPLPDGTPVGISISYVNGLTNLALYDVERHIYGFIIQLVRPSGPPIATYWNDTLLANKGGTVQLTGCYGSYPSTGCHAWDGNYYGVGLGSWNTVNTWWYATSSSSNLGTFIVTYGPIAPDSIIGPEQLCLGSNVTYTVSPDPLPNADPGGYEWVLIDLATGFDLFDLTNQGASININFSLYPLGDKRLKVRGSKSLCGWGPFGPGVNGEGILINSSISPQITNSITTYNLCSGDITNILFQATLPSTTYNYSASASSIFLSGYSSGSLNPVQQTLINSGPTADTVKYRVVPYLTPCSGDTVSFYVIVSPRPQVTNSLLFYSQCSGIFTNIILATDIPGATFSWTASGSSPDVTGFTNGSDQVIAQMLVNSGSGQQTVTYSVIASLNGCSGSVKNFVVTVYPNLPVSVSVTASSNPICTGNQVTFTAYPVNGGISPFFQWQVNGINAGTNNPVYTYLPANSDIITCILTSSAICISNNPASSNQIQITVNPVLSVSISVTVSQNPVCSGTTVAFIAFPTNGGSNPAYQWKVNGIGVGTNSPNYSYIPLNGDLVSCILTSSEPCTISNPASSIQIPMVVNNILTVGITISASANPSCQGSPVAFTAIPTNGGSNPGFQWKVNGSNAGTNSPDFTFNPANGDLVSCTLTSSEPCTSGNPASSITITMTINNNLPAGITITASSNPFCPGSSVTFLATAVNGGSAPVYHWKVDGINAGTNASTFTYNPANNDSVRCVMTSNLACVTGNPASSAKIIMSGSLAPIVTFTSCFDTITTIIAKPIKLKGGIPLGGTYSGPGVNSLTGVFTPSLAGIGTKTITYTYTNAALCTAAKSISILNLQSSIFSCGNTLTDIRDNKIYPTIQIGSQCWMASNLNYGNIISSAQDQRDNCVSEKYCYSDNPGNCTNYGGLYQWDELMRYDESPAAQGFCPPGWHIPDESEWNILFANYINNAFAASPLKYSGYSGFNALLSGSRHINRSWDYQAFATFFWSSTALGSIKAWAHGINDYDPSVSLYPSGRLNALSVRCLKD